MDVGGTLTKIVYFQPKQSAPSNSNSNANAANITSQPPFPEPASPPPFPKRKSSDSLAQLDSPDHQAALQQLYTYMDNTTSQKNNGVLTRDADMTVYSPFLEGQLHFMHFETRNMMTAINVMSSNAVMEHIKSIGCTGGGAHKYANQILDELDITVNKYDELGCLVRGMHFALTNFPDECYTFRNADDAIRGENDHVASDGASSPKDGTSTKDDSVPIAVKRWCKDSKEYTKKVCLPYPSLADFPYLVVNIGSGVSILKVSSPGTFERVSGTSLGMNITL
jgi:type II pantothenate kinase